MVKYIESEGEWMALMEQSKEKLVVVDFTASWYVRGLMMSWCSLRALCAFFYEGFCRFLEGNADGSIEEMCWEDWIQVRLNEISLTMLFYGLIHRSDGLMGAMQRFSCEFKCLDFCILSYWLFNFPVDFLILSLNGGDAQATCFNCFYRADTLYKYSMGLTSNSGEIVYVSRVIAFGLLLSAVLNYFQLLFFANWLLDGADPWFIRTSQGAIYFIYVYVLISRLHFVSWSINSLSIPFL